ncbi:NF-kappa-B-repressing factor-like [Anopheles cruzii]|uniref:NF-kappa-B-repressing factor-like n=1 Tax=Anopheles cruzii TaxID=68878 RepID=UPI0022EC96EF|nr:NF-kappa-B-repressing factor-like [Anopheles cruzii]
MGRRNTDEPTPKKTAHPPNQLPEQKKDKFSFDDYRTHHEVDEHWQLRRLFMEQNQHILEEDELVCLAQVFMNIELMHCRYPPETMRRVAELSDGIAKEYRSQRANMLQRTFVSASDAAASKVQRKDPIFQTGGPRQPTFSATVNRPMSTDEILKNIVVVNNCLVQTQNEFNRLGRGVTMTDSVTELQNNEHEAVIAIGSLVLGKATHCSKKGAQQMARKEALEYLSKHCYTMVRKKLPTQMEGANVVHKRGSGNGTLNGGEGNAASADLKIDTSNVGFQLMQKLGWKGGSLGTRNDGIVDPIAAQIKIGRKGLGTDESNSEGELDTKFIKRVLKNFKDSRMEYDLVFSAEFSKQDRELIHRFAKSFALRTKSFGNDNQGTRQLVVLANRLSPLEIVDKVLVSQDPVCCEMYEVSSPVGSK